MISLLTKPVLIGLAVALGISVAGNAFLANRWVAAREDVATAESDLRQARGAAQQCSDGVAELRTRADTAERESKAAREAAAAARAGRNRKADAILVAPPTTPGNDCKSASDRFNRYLEAR